MSNKYWLFLDDERDLSAIYPQDSTSGMENWTIVRSFEDATKLILEKGCPSFISFDNDLGTPKEGYDLAVWLTEMDLDGVIDIPSDFDFWVHSANPVSWNRITSLLYSYLDFKKEELLNDRVS
ncbi:MAG TPA: cyclic-phosphate processing receiver domain-containing protein [Methanosarcina sp.]|nr:cyclic-phosphate processing receiver domain-containing protein [Methanosarcina sp.]